MYFSSFDAFTQKNCVAAGSPFAPLHRLLKRRGFFMPDITDHEGNNWLDGAKVGRESRKNGDRNPDNATSKGVDIEPPPRATESEKPALEQPQPEKIPPGGGTKRGM